MGEIDPTVTYEGNLASLQWRHMNVMASQITSLFVQRFIQAIQDYFTYPWHVDVADRYMLRTRIQQFQATCVLPV